MKLQLKSPLEYPKQDAKTNGRYSIDVLIVFDNDLYVGYYKYSENEWRWTDKSNQEEITFVFSDDYNDFGWCEIVNPK